MRRLLIAHAILAVLLVGADIGSRILTQRMVARRIQASLHLSNRPSVSLDGFPFLLHFAEGSFPAASARGSGLRDQSVSFKGIALTLRDIRFDPGSVLSGNDRTVRASSGTGTATMTETEANEALHARGINASVRFANGKVFVRSPLLRREIPARLSVSGRVLVVHSSDPAVPQSFSVALPQFLAGLHFTSVRIEGSTIVLGFRLGPLSLGTS